MTDIIHYGHNSQEDLIELLSSLRRYKGITQSDLDDSIVSTKSNVSRFEHNTHSPTLKTLCNYINAIGYDFEIVLINRDKG